MIKIYKIAVISLLLISVSLSLLFASENQEINFPEGYTDTTEELYSKDEFPPGIHYFAEELVLLPSGEYEEKYLHGELEIVEKINDSLYKVKPYISINKRIKFWRESWFKSSSGHNEPVYYLFIPYNAPDITGMDILSNHSQQVRIFSIENMTDEKKIIKNIDQRKEIPEYTVFFKYFGYLKVGDKVYPYQEKSETIDSQVSEHPISPPGTSDKEEGFFSFLSFFSSSDEVDSQSGEKETSPDEVVSASDEVKSSPNKVESASDELKSTPDEAVSASDEVKSSPNKVESASDELKSTPDEVQSSPSKIENPQNEVKSSTDEPKSKSDNDEDFFNF